MSNLKHFTVDSETIEILKCGRIGGNIFYLPQITLERFQYDAVNKALIAMGAKWNKKSKGHVFDYDIREELERVISTGEVTDWKKSTDFFYTPEAVVNEMLGLVAEPCEGAFDMLEPSAGQGHILDVFKENFYNAHIYCVEQNPLHCTRLTEKGYRPVCNDFMNIMPFAVDLVLMNPPFTYEMEHIRHAYDFVRKDGCLITICSGNILTKSTKKGKEFKAWFDEMCGYDYVLPENSFKECGTSVSTKMLVFQK